MFCLFILSASISVVGFRSGIYCLIVLFGFFLVIFSFYLKTLVFFNNLLLVMLPTVELLSTLICIFPLYFLFINLWAHL